ncbi:MAG: PLP-dependent aminotransferase family protein [Oscillospiraceae bacterium]|nr:PLP-dependent aminotransferase family protein [Oscillospiraceae bacterium]
MSKTNEIREEIMEMIRLGIIGPGEKMPSIRSMAKKYGVSITPVNDAYNALVAQQLVESRPQSGYYVTSSIDHLREELDLQLHVGLNKSEHYSMVDDFFSGYSEIAFNANNDIEFSFGSTSGTSTVYPEMNFNNFLVNYIQRSKEGFNPQVKLHDELRLKKSMLRYMRHCGCKNGIEDVSVVRSVTEGVMLAIRACTGRGGLVAIEAPGHIGFYFIAKYLERDVVSIPSKVNTGLDVDAFESYLNQGIKPGCIVLSSTFSNPTGAVMPDENKQRLVRICREHDITIIEDDILGELYFGEKRPKPIKSFDDENVIYVSGYGKSLSPKTRLGYVSAGKFKGEFAFYKHISTSYAHPYFQMAMADYLDSGAAIRDVSFFRRWLKKCVFTYRDTILEAFPKGTKVEEPKGGPYLWVGLPEGCSANKLSEMAKKIGVSISPSHLFNAKEDMANYFRFNCVATHLTEKSIEAVKKLGSLAHTLAE